MTDDQTLMELDRRARQAATAVNRAVAHEAIPTFDPNRVPGSAAAVVRPLPVAGDGNARGRRSGRRWIPLVSIAAALLVLAAVAVGSVLTRSDEQSGPADRVRTANPDGLEASYLPDGLTMSGVVVGTTSPDVPASRMAATFGPDPAGTALSAVALVTDGLRRPPGARPVDAGDRAAWLVEAGGRNSVQVQTGPDQSVALSGASLDTAALVRAARHLEPDVDGAPDIAPAGLPPGWHRLTTLPSDEAMGAASVLRDGTVGVSYQDEQRSRAFAVETSRGTEADLYLPRTQLTDVRSTTVRGHPGIVGVLEGDSPTPPAAVILSWFEQPGHLVRITAQGVSEAEVRKVADGLKPLAGERLTKLSQRTATGDDDPDDQRSTLLGAGATPEGKHWTVRAGADGRSLDREVKVTVAESSGDSTATAGSGSSGTSGGADVFGTIGNERIDSTRVVYGLVGPRVATVDASFGSRHISIVVTPVHDVGGYAVEVPVAASVDLEALDADGKVLGRATAGADDRSTTGGGTTSSPTPTTTGPTTIPGG